MHFHLVAFALIGLLTGVAARTFFQGASAMRILGTWALGVIGAVAAGLISLPYWPAVEDHIHLGNLVMAFLGAALAILISIGLAQARRSA